MKAALESMGNRSRETGVWNESIWVSLQSCRTREMLQQSGLTSFSLVTSMAVLNRRGRSGLTGL